MYVLAFELVYKSILWWDKILYRGIAANANLSDVKDRGIHRYFSVANLSANSFTFAPRVVEDMRMPKPKEISQLCF